MSKPKVNTKCVADHYSMPNEKIVEVTGQGGQGCLISVSNHPDGSVVINLYRIDTRVVIKQSEKKG